MQITCFTIASMLLRLKGEPFPFERISRFKCKKFMVSYPNGLTRTEINNMFEKHQLGGYYFKRGSSVFTLDLEEKSNSVILHKIFSNDSDPSSFMNSYKHLVDKVHYEHAIFVDTRFESPPSP